MSFVAILAGMVFSAAYCDRADYDYDAFRPHRCASFRATPGGHWVCNDPKGSVQAGYVTEAEIDACVDGWFDTFYASFPKFAGLNPTVELTDDYVFWTGRQWAAGLACGPGCGTVLVALWSRIETATDPGDVWIKRPPGEYFGVTYAAWRHTGRQLAPALTHELLHEAIGDPAHRDARWGSVPGTCAACFPGDL